jgi:hypothetical protein
MTSVQFGSPWAVDTPMRQEDLLEVLRQRPFQPFRIHVPDGIAYEIRHPELVLVGRSKAVVFFADPHQPPPAFDKYETVALLHITRLEPIETLASSN